jgi:hypothetical protein
MLKTSRLSILAAFAAISILGFGAMRSGNPSGNATPIVDADDVLSVQCTPRTVTGNTTLVKADNKCGVLVTATATVTVDTAANLGEGFEAPVWADGATATVSAGSTLSVTTGTYTIVRVAHVKRWVAALATAARDG